MSVVWKANRLTKIEMKVDTPIITLKGMQVYQNATDGRTAVVL